MRVGDVRETGSDTEGARRSSPPSRPAEKLPEGGSHPRLQLSLRSSWLLLTVSTAAVATDDYQAVRSERDRFDMIKLINHQ